MATTLNRPRRNLRPASGNLHTAVLIMMDRYGMAEFAAGVYTRGGLSDQAYRERRRANRRSRALERLIAALARGGAS